MLHAVHGSRAQQVTHVALRVTHLQRLPHEDDEPRHHLRQPPRETLLRQEEAEVRQRLSPFYGFREMLVSNVNGLNLVGNSAPKY
jgi:hypothetical protein